MKGATSVGQPRLLLGRRLYHLTLGALERNIGVCAMLLYVMMSEKKGEKKIERRCRIRTEGAN